ncbi:MAG TPA: hypothetical protein VKC89_01085 [Patescibacteria group bacterium]|nr:hypothetical protein [Patescibacteria group bacterium]
MADSKFGVAAIALLVLGVILFFGVLNYFNIISLSSLYPNQFGSLPHKISYEQYAKSHFPKPQELSKSTNTWVVNSLFLSKTDKNFTVAGSTGITTFNLDKNTIFLKVTFPKNKTASNTATIPSDTKQYSNAPDFFQQIKPGSLLLIIYSSSSNIAKQIQYVSSFSMIE